MPAPALSNRQGRTPVATLFPYTTLFRSINALTVDYSSANLTGFASGAPSNGDVVEAQGTSFDATTQTLTATHVRRDRKSTRLNSSHEWNSYAVFCLKKKK